MKALIPSKEMFFKFKKVSFLANNNTKKQLCSFRVPQLHTNRSKKISSLTIDGLSEKKAIIINEICSELGLDNS